MRDFFITWMERLLGLFVFLSVLGVIGAVVMTIIQGQPKAWLAAGMMLLVGAVSIILTFGFAYIALGIHANTRRSAEALEALARAGGVGRKADIAPGLVPQSGPVRRAGPPVVHGPVKPDNSHR